jgi:glucans biosynthesis protein
MHRYRVLTLIFAVVCVYVAPAVAAQGADPAQDVRSQERRATPFNRTILIEQAKKLASQPYVEPRVPGGQTLERLNYDQYRSIRFQRGASIWGRENRNFAVDLFHLGFIYRTPVHVNLVVGGLARRVFFTEQIFEYGPGVPVIETNKDMGYSGFGVKGPINRPDVLEEFLAFQGASYFRAIARDQQYGISARGLAIRTARPEGEEFPVFTEFWIERPPELASHIKIHALLDSASVVIDVQATLFARTEVSAYGIAPLTSMFLFDGTNPGRFDDFRLAVHDSDGLQILNGNGEQIWRPLANGRLLQVSAFVDNNPQGFGLVQRKRKFTDYQDYDARYERRPSLWVEPRGDWGEGHVELVEIPSDREIHDNIVAYWQPKAPLVPGEPIEFNYRLRWLDEPLAGPLAKVIDTRQGRGQNANLRKFMIDFQSDTPPPEDLKIEVSSSAGQVQEARGQLLTPTGAYRVTFELDPQRADVIELRAALVSKGKPWSETWLYRWSR